MPRRKKPKSRAQVPKNKAALQKRLRLKRWPSKMKLVVHDIPPLVDVPDPNVVIRDLEKHRRPRGCLPRRF